MHTILVVIFFLFFSIFTALMYPVELVIGKRNPRLQASTSQAVARASMRIILFLSGVRAEASGMEKIPRDRAVLYVSNHRGFFDIVLGYATLPTLTGFVSKKEVGKIPFLRVWMEFMNCLFLDRGNPKEGLKVILKGIENIKEGYSVFIMPEGTRNKGEGVLPFHEGSMKLATKTGCPIIPVAIAHTDEIFERHIPWIHGGRAAIRYGDPIDVSELGKEERKFLGAHTKKVIEDMLREM